MLKEIKQLIKEHRLLIKIAKQNELLTDARIEQLIENNIIVRKIFEDYEKLKKSFKK